MEEFKAKTCKLRREIDQAEERERSASQKKDVFVCETEKFEEEVNTLKRRKQLVEKMLEDVEDHCYKQEKLREDQLARIESEKHQRKILDELEREDEERIEKLEELIKQNVTKADYNEKKCDECWRRIQTVTCENERFKSRLRFAEEKRRELEEQSKFVGRNLRTLAASEEKWGDREEAYDNKIRELGELIRDAEIRYEAAERKIRRLEKDRRSLQEKLDCEQQKIHDARSLIDETMNGLDRV